MKFTAEITFADRSDPAAIGGEAIAGVARAVEAAGFDAIGFNEHPIPSLKWLNAGGHDAYDPFVVHAWCAAVTQRIRLIPFLFILPYRNPFITAKSIASLDVLSGGRMVAATGLGYLRSEFGALGVPFEERHARFDEAIACMKAAWAGEGVTHVGKFFQAHNQVATPLPIQKPHPPIWIGGNSRTVRQRVARYGQGWAPIPGGAVMAQTTRTVAMETLPAIQAAMDDLHRLLQAEGRDPSSVEVQMSVGAGLLADSGPAAHIDYLHTLEKMGVTQHIHHFQLGGSQKARESLDQFGEQIVRAYA
jgi:probable F420-dependent oxidoreductase